MDFFDWRTLINDIPDEWLATQGKGVRIAILDAGAELGHPAFAHLNMAGRKFWPANPQPRLPDEPVGEDPVGDIPLPSGQMHGTACLSVMAAQPENELRGIRGIAPLADFVVVKVANSNGNVLEKNFLAGLRVALRQEVDLVVSSVFTHSASAPAPKQMVDNVFQNIVQQGTALIFTLENGKVFLPPPAVRFPTKRPECIAVGSVTETELAARPNSADATLPRFDILMPALPVSACTGTGYEPQPVFCSCSFATAYLAGLTALLLAHWKEKEGDLYRRRTRAEILQQLRTLQQSFIFPEPASPVLPPL